MNIALLRQVLANDRAASAATREARRITTKTFATHPTESMNPQPQGQNTPSGLPQSQVESQLSLLEAEISDIADIIAKMNDRLSCVARYRDIPDESAETVEETLVQLADRIRNAFRNERKNNIALRALLAAIEL